MRAAFGKGQHPAHHAVSWTDRPIRSTTRERRGRPRRRGLGLKPHQQSWIFLEATGQVFRGDAGDVFRSSKRSDLTYVGHLRGYRTSARVPTSTWAHRTHGEHNNAGIVGEEDIGRFVTDLWGVDATVRWRPLRRAIYNSFVVARSSSGAVASSHRPPVAFGYYVPGTINSTPMVRGRSLRPIRRADDAAARDDGGSLLLTYWPSEFSQVRGQFRRTRYAEARTPTKSCSSSCSRLARMVHIRFRGLIMNIRRCVVGLAAAAVIVPRPRMRRAS